MNHRLSKAEILLLSLAACLAGAVLLGPAISLPAQYHQFADSATWLGVPFAMDVLSNLPFAIVGVLGLVRFQSAPLQVGRIERAMADMFFFGLVLTAFSSSWYHWRPDDSGLVVDRMGMSVAFAGLLGLAAANRISDRAGAAVGILVLLLAPAAVSIAATAGNSLPWAVLQFGGLGLVVLCSFLPLRRGALQVRWMWVVAIYALAKVFELQDHAVFEATSHLVSGHTVKHLLAAAAALPVLASQRSSRLSVQNARGHSENKGSTARGARIA